MSRAMAAKGLPPQGKGLPSPFRNTDEEDREERLMIVQHWAGTSILRMCFAWIGSLSVCAIKANVLFNPPTVLPVLLRA